MEFAQRTAGATETQATRRWARFVASGIFTLLSVLIVALLWRRVGVIGDPGLYLLLTVAAATYLAGGMAGMLSSAIVLFCSFVLFSHPQYPFRYSDLDWRQMMVIAISCPVIALMVGSLKEQVDRLRVVSAEARQLQSQVRRLQGIREALTLCEQRFGMIAECMTEYAVCVLDANGAVRNWNQGAERLLGYAEQEIMGQSYSRFFAKDELLARHPDRLLTQARFSGRISEDSWRVRKGGGRFPCKTHVFQMQNAEGLTSGYLLVIKDLSNSTIGVATNPPRV